MGEGVGRAGVGGGWGGCVWGGRGRGGQSFGDLQAYVGFNVRPIDSMIALLEVRLCHIDST